jgi:2-C-methyl-D-erythritol 4-phosphate cytidylyltransferase
MSSNQSSTNTQARDALNNIQTPQKYSMQANGSMSKEHYASLQKRHTTNNKS